MTKVQVVAFAWVALVLGLIAVHIWFPQRSGTIALTEVFEPYLVVLAILALPVFVRQRPPLATIVAVVLVVTAVARYGPVLVSTPQPEFGPSVRVATWNMLADTGSPVRILAGLRDIQADVVGIQELLPQAADALAADPGLLEAFPYRFLAPERTVLGIGLLSRYPITVQASESDPPLVRAAIHVSNGTTFTAIVVHPLPARIRSFGPVPLALDTVARDAALSGIRGMVDDELAAGRSVVLLGDFNVTEREPAYFDLAAGLRDAHLETGWGPGFTWAPPGVQALPVGILRIDYIFTSADLRPVDITGNCGLPSDHCLVMATIGLGNQGQPAAP